MNIFLTGGTGFIGSYVAMALVNQGHEVTVLARNPDKVPALKQIPQLHLVQGDIEDLALLERLIAGKDACVLVALNYTKQTGWEVLTDDTLPTVYIADIAAKAGVKQLIYTSSTAVNDNVYTPDLTQEQIPDKHVSISTPRQPTTFYGATKAASEHFLIAQSYQSDMRVNVVRPGYTFGNPIVNGADSQPDRRFMQIVQSACQHQPIELTQHDGTQFIWAGDLAALYTSILTSDVNRKIYFGLSTDFVSWEAIAREAIKRSNSKSQLIINDKGWGKEPIEFDVTDMDRDFGLAFNSWNKIQDHLDYLISLYS
jgi:UDP-glucose 4-epimerase